MNLILISPAFQLFDEDNPLHKSDNKYIFTTEGHVVPIDKRFREKQWNDLFPCEEGVLAEQEPINRPPPNKTSNVRPPSSPGHWSFSVFLKYATILCIFKAQYTVQGNNIKQSICYVDLVK